MKNKITLMLAILLITHYLSPTVLFAQYSASQVQKIVDPVEAKTKLNDGILSLRKKNVDINEEEMEKILK